MAQTKALPGFRDFYPEDLALRAHIFRAWREVATRYGFEEYDGPPLEPLELYTAKSGEEIVAQLYEFTDKGDRRVALRPEMTPTLARMVGARANGLKKPIRWFSIPQLFRYERQQRGRLREHFQLNCDLVGEAGPLADAEIIALGIDVLRTLGLSENDFRVRLSDRRVLTALLTGAGVPPEKLTDAFTLIDKVERLSGDQLRAVREGKEGGFSPTVAARLLEIAGLRGWPAVESALAETTGGLVVGELLRSVASALKAMGLESFVEIDLTIVRGLAYYTGTVFELFDARGELRAICGGGRYDNLVGALGGVDLPCVGFGMGDVVLGELLKGRGLVPEMPSSIDVFVVGIEGADLEHVLRIAHELRRAGVRVEYGLNAQPIAKQLRLADARRARFALVMGGDERARGEVTLKDLATKTQRLVARDAIVAELTRAIEQ